MSIEKNTVTKYTLSTLPPSTNQLYNKTRGKWYKTKKYSKWITEAGWEIKSQPYDEVHQFYGISIHVPSHKNSVDIDNLIKPTVDLLVRMGRISDDKNMQWVHAEYYPGQMMLVFVHPCVVK